ncbi:hypothetical protein [Hansschlegelia zhihuaiae]|uniref:Uncharacterized protein n=1 Tax=Hansschlegelia zhihuaiae TaxID=405005 RepID=A0A4Q0MID8_9HYPH|nr:hypothetical protein [Hansschlegelia zhihuaiae]RXF73340.1 hypothetical protein EK403_10970 [Hansschlegelia zhihuaiae]
MRKIPAENVFILSVFDREQWCPVLQARFVVQDLNALACILGEDADDDPELRDHYVLEDADLQAIGDRFGVDFNTSGMEFGGDELEISLFRPHSISKAPYLIHTGYELPLLLDGRKKLARMSDAYPPDQFEGEDRFDRWVATGVLHKEVVVEPFDEPVSGYLGHRTVYYTPMGEQWRIPAMKMLSEAAGRSGGWNEYFERLEGMLFGYSDQENDWWIDVGLTGGGFGGIPLCCAVDSNGLEWIEAAGFRALPPIDQPHLLIAHSKAHAGHELRTLFFESGEAVAIVRFNVLGRHLMELTDLAREGPWEISSEQIPLLNQNIRGLIAVVARR